MVVDRYREKKSQNSKSYIDGIAVLRIENKEILS